MSDPHVTEIMVNAGSDVWVERDGRLEHVGRMRSATLLTVIEHMLAPVGRRLDRAHPTVDARLPDGVAAERHDRTRRGGRAVPHDPPLPGRNECHWMPSPWRRSWPCCAAVVRHRCNVVVSGATSSGKTTLLERAGSRGGARVPHHHHGGRR